MHFYSSVNYKGYKEIPNDSPNSLKSIDLSGRSTPDNNKEAPHQHLVTPLDLESLKTSFLTADGCNLVTPLNMTHPFFTEEDTNPKVNYKPLQLRHPDECNESGPVPTTPFFNLEIETENDFNLGNKHKVEIDSPTKPAKRSRTNSIVTPTSSPKTLSQSTEQPKTTKLRNKIVKLPVKKNNNISFIGVPISPFVATIQQNFIFLKDCETTFDDFLNQLSKKSSEKDNLEALHFLVTASENVSSAQYENINNFLMPVWIFNKLTAKDLINYELMSEFIDLIKGNSLNLIENSSALITKKLENAYKSTMNQLSDEQSNNISKMFTEMTSNMINLYTKAKSDKDTPLTNNQANAEFTYSESFYNLLDTFLNACRDEKLPNQSEKELKLRNRVSSGGCDLLVQGIADILNIKPYNISEEIKIKINNLQELQAKANIYFNDAISLYKEVKEGEINGDSLASIYADSSPKSWFRNKMDNYKDCINEFNKLFDQLNENNELTGDAERFIHLTKCSLTGIPLWSWMLTNRYELLDDQEKAENVTKLETIKIIYKEVFSN